MRDPEGAIVMTLCFLLQTTIHLTTPRLLAT
jgi:hypothetical protein